MKATRYPSFSETNLNVESSDSSLPRLAQTDWFGTVLGAVTFLFGIGMLFLTFFKAAEMFSLSPAQVVGEKRDITEIGLTVTHVLLRIGLLLVMCIVGSIISGKGVRMYLAARARALSRQSTED
jgi:hypothetical protein